MIKPYTVGLSLLLFVCTGVGASDSSATADNGTDPTRLQRSIQAQWEHLDLNNDVNSNTLRLNYTEPLGVRQHYSLRVRVPIASVDALGNNNYALGDASLMLSHVYGLTREHGFVLQGEAIFDTAERTELGAGKDVFKGTFIYALFLDEGAIFAPAFVQSLSFAGDTDHSDVNATTFDFYYVPKLKDSRNLLTLDPALNFDWENNKQYASLAITFGRVLGKALGGNNIVTVKPSLFAGGGRPGCWGIELGYKILGH